MKSQSEFTYLKIARLIEHQILTGALRAGDKLPSLRTLCREYGVSQNTALSTYYHLEGRMLIEARPQSGYYVRYARLKLPELPPVSQPESEAYLADSNTLVTHVYQSLGEEGGRSLAMGTPSLELLPVQRLNKELTAVSRELPGSGVLYGKTEGSDRLRRQIARWALMMGARMSPDDLIATDGCLSALSYSLMAVANRGDTVAMESPVSFGMLQLAQSLGLKVLELPSHPQTGVDLNAVEEALCTDKIDVCLFIPNFSNPLGSCIPDEDKKALVRMLEKYQVPLIENDLNGDVYFSERRPASCKTFDESGLVLWCGSVSKTLAPGYRVGWVSPGRFKDKVRRMKQYLQITSASLPQQVIAAFMETGRYDNHLRKLRSTLYSNSLRLTNAIGAWFPEGTKASRPQGGFVMWVELPACVDTVALLQRAVKRGISFAPGRIFTLQDQYHNCLRLNYGVTWDEKLEASLRELGRLAREAASV